MYIMVDVESDGPIPGPCSMISFGAIVCRDTSQTFYGKLRPISEYWIPAALAISGFTREQVMEFPTAESEMMRFLQWLHEMQLRGKDRFRFISDNNGYDWQFINWYLWKFCNKNPFGHSSTNLGSLYKGLVKDDFKNFKHLRKTKHTHNPVDDAMGNAEALIYMKNEMGLKIIL
jgi:hypothetical protein